jgi:hypothetical protein
MPRTPLHVPVRGSHPRSFLASCLVARTMYSLEKWKVGWHVFTKYWHEAPGQRKVLSCHPIGNFSFPFLRARGNEQLCTALDAVLCSVVSFAPIKGKVVFRLFTGTCTNDGCTSQHNLKILSRTNSDPTSQGSLSQRGSFSRISAPCFELTRLATRNPHQCKRRSEVEKTCICLHSDPSGSAHHRNFSRRLMRSPLPVNGQTRHAASACPRSWLLAVGGYLTRTRRVQKPATHSVLHPFFLCKHNLKPLVPSACLQPSCEPLHRLRPLRLHLVATHGREYPSIVGHTRLSIDKVAPRWS